MTTTPAPTGRSRRRPAGGRQAAEAAGAARGEAGGGVLNVFSHGFLSSGRSWRSCRCCGWCSARSRTTARSSPARGRCPTQLRFDNWARAWTKAHIGRYFLNSVVVVAVSLVGTMLLGSMAAYVLARYEFRGQPVHLLPVRRRHDVPGLPGPGAAVLRGQEPRPAGHLPGLILVYIAYSLPFTVFFLTAFFRTLPTSVAEAAMIDGCSHTRLFFRVMLPMAKPGLISVGDLQLPRPLEPVPAAAGADHPGAEDK